MWFVALVVTIGAFFLISRSLRKLGRLRRTNATMLETPELSAQSPVGSMVKTAGRITHPATTTPYGKRSASYWDAEVCAVFQTKKKKPAKGIETHRVLLDRMSSEDLPLIITSTAGDAVHLCFQGPRATMKHLNTNQDDHASLPEALRDKAKPKYESYSLRERYYPPGEKVTVLGKLADRNAGCMTLTDPDDAAVGALVTPVALDVLVARNARAMVHARILIGVYVAAAVAFWMIYGVAG
ncbi:MAG: hypothetical protein OEZ06_32325 [Myxococcales bacterium]|nr:hypothetical protein [Myxococcales bacterium]